MTKDFSNEVEQWITQHPLNRGDRNLVIFSALRPDIASAVADGYSVKTIWRVLHESGRIPFGYETFLKYVKRQIRHLHAPPGAATPPPATSVSSHNLSSGSAGAPPDKPRTLPAKIDGFVFDPVPVRKELI